MDVKTEQVRGGDQRGGKGDDEGPLAAGQTLAERYIVGERLGRGGGGTVYRAFDRGIGEWIAIKVLNPERWSGGARSEPLFRELRHARAIQHPHVCRVFDVVGPLAPEGPCFLTMALADGGSLRDTMNQAPERTWTERVSDVRGVAAGLAALHAAGIVHRDVKPENVLRMRDGRVLLSDFGLAVAPAVVTHVTGGVGTPVYMAPELQLGAPADVRADVWSLGLLMHETLFGARPAEAKNATTTAPVAGAAERRSRRRLRALCAWCLRPQPAERPAHAGEVLRALDRVSAGRWLALPRRGPRGWPALALGALALAALALAAVLAWRGRAPVAGINRELPVAGAARPLADRVRLVAELGGRIHCLHALPDGSLGMVWGEPRRAEIVQPASGARTPWDIPAAAYHMPPSDFPDPIENNCPQLSPDGKRLLYSSRDASGASAIFLQEGGAAPRLLTAGSLPVWHASGELAALRVDDSHPGIFNMLTRHLTVLTPPREQHRGLMILQLAFAGGGRHLLVRAADTVAGYSLTRYDLERFQPVGGVLVRPGADEIVRVTMGASSEQDLLVHAMMPDGRYGLALLDWGGPRLRWLGQLAPFDVTNSARTRDGSLLLVARRWTSDLQVLRDGKVVHTVVTDSPGMFGDANQAGDVAIQTDRGGRVMVVLYRAGQHTSQVLGPGPLDGVPRFTDDGRAVLMVRTNQERTQDQLVLCQFDGACRVLGQVPSADLPTLSEAGDRVVYLAWQPYPHAALLDVASGRTRILSSSLFCPPRWSGNDVWLARGSTESWNWVELRAADGQPTGRQVPGTSGCAAAGPGPGGILAQRLRIVQRETSRLLAVTSPLPAP